MGNAKKKRILVFAGGAYVSGAEIVALNVMRELKARGNEVRCIANGWNDGDFIRRLEAIDVRCDDIKLGYLYLSHPAWTIDSLLHYPQAATACARIIREYRPDVLHFHGYRNLLMLPISFGGAPVVVHMHEVETIGVIRRAIINRWLLRRVDAFIAVSRFIKADLVSKGIPPERVHVAHPAIAIEGSPGVQPLHGSDEPARIGIVGQIIASKGHTELLEALAMLHRKGLEFTLEVYGRGPDDWTATLLELTRRLGLSSRVHWHGFVRDRSAIYGGLDFVVVPSRGDEAFGMVAAEPALWGIPAIVADSGGLSEVVQDETTGLLVRPGDVRDLSAKIERLLRDPELRTRLGRAAHTYVTEAFSVAHSIDAVESAFSAAALGLRSRRCRPIAAH